MPLDDAALRAALGPAAAAWDRTTLRCAAVLVPLFRRDGEDHVLFTVRPRHLPSHPGQIAFPGGAREGYEDPVSCALRETHEELGLPPAGVNILGGLPARASTSRFRVHVVVGRIPDPDGLHPDPAEVERLLTVPLPDLRRDDAFTHEASLRPDGQPYPASPHFRWRGDVVWGLTGRVVWDLIHVVRSLGDRS